MLLKKIFAAAAACACALSFAGCDKGDDSSSVASSSSVAQTESPSSAAPVELKDYSFPEFLADAASDEMLISVTAVDFDPAVAQISLAESPFKSYDCKSCIFGEFYVFEEDGFIGIVNSNGNIVIDAEKYARAEPVSNCLVRLDYPAESGKGSELIRLEDGYGTIVKAGFDENEITVEELYDEETGKTQYQLVVSGRADEKRIWDKLERVSPSSVQTQRNFSAIYRGVIGSRTYYVTFDDYYNITIYEAAYALVRLKVSEDYGECFIVDGDDYSELGKMIDSFGSESQLAKPSKDETLDYIQITFGLNTDEQTVITISADGFCLRDKINSKTQPANKYFSTYSKETFVDLVNWVEEVLSQEYEQPEAEQ